MPFRQTLKSPRFGKKEPIYNELKPYIVLNRFPYLPTIDYHDRI